MAELYTVEWERLMMERVDTLNGYVANLYRLKTKP